jgi:hypothetical protein
MSDSDNKVIQLAKKLKELADRGEGGEKNSAEYHLNKLLEKHKLTLEDILEEKRDVRMFKVSKEKETLFFQIVGSVAGKEATRHHKDRTSIWLNLTTTEYLEIDAKFDFYWRAYKEELGIFYSAFVQKNKLYCKPSKNDEKDEKELSKEERDKLRRVFAMMDGIRHHSLNKQIESK